MPLPEGIPGGGNARPTQLQEEETLLSKKEILVMILSIDKVKVGTFRIFSRLNLC